MVSIRPEGERLSWHAKTVDDSLMEVSNSKFKAWRPVSFAIGKANEKAENCKTISALWYKSFELDARCNAWFTAYKAAWDSVAQAGRMPLYTSLVPAWLMVRTQKLKALALRVWHAYRRKVLASVGHRGRSSSLLTTWQSQVRDQGGSL
jgi:hypothetical protein